MTEKAQKIINAIEKVSWDWENMNQSHPHTIAVATLRELINQCSYNNFDIDGDHGINVVNVKDIMSIIEELGNGN
jgi:hypothetical protein